jgi:tetratricopeptide (TPR) repeat protein
LGVLAIGYDLFMSYAHADQDRVRAIVAAFIRQGLRVFLDDTEIDDFASITRTIATGLADSKVLVAFFSTIYPTRRACQWELTAAFLAAQYQGDPRQRVLVINPETSPDHIHPVELRDALYLRTSGSDDKPGLDDLARRVASQVTSLSGTLGSVTPLVPPGWAPLQGVGSTRFVGRLTDMWQIHSALHAQTVAPMTGAKGPAVAQVRGLGGVGKSLLAEEYALRFGAAYPGGIYWLRIFASHLEGDISADQVMAEYVDQLQAIAARLGLSIEDSELAHGPRKMSDFILGVVAREIERRSEPCLWVVDDVPDGLDGHQLRRLFSPHPLACTLITTRSRRYDALATPVDLDVLPKEDAYALLTSRRRPKDAGEDKAAWGIVDDLGGHALAIDVAGAALRNQEDLISFARFHGNLRSSTEDELELAIELADTLPNGHEKSIAQTLLRSIRALNVEGQDFLRVAAILAPAPLPAMLVAAVFRDEDALDECAAIGRTSRAIEQVASQSLASKVGEDETGNWLVHALVSRTVRLHDMEPIRERALRAAAVHVLAHALAPIVDPRAYAAMRDLVPHARELVRQPANSAEANLLGWVARHDYERGEYRSAEALWRRQWKVYQRQLGKEHPSTLAAMGSLANSLHYLGDLTGALRLQEQVLEATRRVLGEEHPDTFRAMSDLTRTLDDLGDLNGARRLGEQVLEATRRVLGEEHPGTLSVMANLAHTLHSLGDLNGARTLKEQVLDVTRRERGEEHPNTLRAMSNLASTLRAQGDLAGARTLQEQVLEATRRGLGEEHPDTLHAMGSLALILYDLGDLGRARELQQQVVDAFRRSLGPEHFVTLTAMNNLGWTLRGLGDLTGARTLQQQVLELSRRVLGEEHPDTLRARNNLASTLHALGDPGGAQRLLEQVLETGHRLLGVEHPNMLTTMGNLANTLRDQGDLEGTRELEEQVLEVTRRVLGENHPNTLRAMNNLASTLDDLGDLTAARTLKEQVLEARRRQLGEEHPETLTTMDNLAISLVDLGDLTAARTLQEQVLEARRRQLGEEHPETLTTMNNLAGTLYRLGDLVRARTLQEQVLEISRQILGDEHPDTLSSMDNLSYILNAVGEHERAAALEAEMRQRGRLPPD